MAINPPLDKVAANLKQWIAGLVDESRRNRLLYFKTERSGFVRLIEPSADELFKRLATQGQTLTFAGPTPQRLLDIGSVRPLGDKEVRADDSHDHLASSLYGLRQRARSSLEEMGANSLYVTFGMLEWDLPAVSDDPFRPRRSAGTAKANTKESVERIQSPLLLLPVSLNRASIQASYSLHRLGDADLEVNPHLAEKLRRDFGLNLALPNDAEKMSLEAILAHIRECLGASAREWKVRATTDTGVNEVFLGIFSFLKLAMYQDLRDHFDKLIDDPLVRVLAGDSQALPQTPDDIPSGRELDEKLHPADALHILDADSSQLAVLAAAKRGTNLIIEGPPGTGKSQTIANLIGQALADQKRVLFVSEKRAALEVVFERLKQAGLGSFCLEAHGNKADKKSIVAQLKEAWDETVRYRPGHLKEPDYERLRRRRSELNEYVRALHTIEPKLGISPFHAHAELARRARVADLVFDLLSDRIASLTRSGLDELTDLVFRLARSGSILLDEDSNPWKGTTFEEWSHQLQAELERNLRAARAALTRARELGRSLSLGVGLVAPDTLSGVDTLSDLAAQLTTNPGPPSNWFTAADLEAIRDEASAYRSLSVEYLARRATLSKRYDDRFFSLDLDSLAASLGPGAKAALDRVSYTSNTAGLDALANGCEDFEGSLDELTSALDTLIGSVAEIVDASGMASANALAQLRQAHTMLGLVCSDPRPQREWLDRVTLILRRDEARVAAAHARTVAEDGAAIRAEYASEILGEAIALSARLDTYRDGLMLAFNLACRRDIARVQSWHLAHRKHTISEVRAIVRQAKSVVESQAWLDAHSIELANRFGHHRLYSGSTTDWASLTQALETTLAIWSAFDGDGIPPSIASALLSGGSALAGRRTVHELVDRALGKIDVAADRIGQRLRIADLIAPDRSLLDARKDIQALRGGLHCIRSATDALRGTLRTGQQVSASQLAVDAASGAETLRLGQRLLAAEPRLGERLGHFFRGVETDWDRLFAALDWLIRVRSASPSVAASESFVARNSGPSPLARVTEAQVAELRQSTMDARTGLAYVAGIFSPDVFPPGGTSVDETELDLLTNWIALRETSVPKLDAWLEYLAACRDCEASGLAGFLEEIRRTRPAPYVWSDAFLKQVYRLWLDVRRRELPTIGRFQVVDHEALVSEFRALDRASIDAGAARVRESVLASRRRLDDGRPRDEQERILIRELEKRRHGSMRTLFGRIPNLLLALKPCLLLSPLTVSQLLDPELIDFDLVIFDEASQVSPADALGAILRGTQLIVAGDSKQLPPTDFFSLQLNDEQDDDDDAPTSSSQGSNAPRAESALPLESIMKQCREAGLRSQGLEWHYRSHDERLIAFSNHHFYGGHLVTFPTSERRDDRGVLFEFVSDGVYDRGGARTNRVEAQRVVQLIVAHAHAQATRPAGDQQSLGVVAFSSAQMNAIHNELEKERRAQFDPIVELFLREDRSEPVFIKNLESVQGDERDVILFSLGYGKAADGQLTYNFGPLNRERGERRLNVAVTRARDKVVFVASIQPDDLDPKRLTSEGARALGRYLRYAKEGPSSLDAGLAEYRDEHDSPFEEAVADALRRAGLTIRAQIGCSGYRVDLGVVDPDAPGRYLLGIECDGATYHSSQTARDRDRLRQSVLEQHGWQIHRIWSTNWIRNPQEEIEKVLSAVAAKRTAISEEQGTAIPLRGAIAPDGRNAGPAPRRDDGHQVAGRWMDDFGGRRQDDDFSGLQESLWPNASSSRSEPSIGKGNSVISESSEPVGNTLVIHGSGESRTGASRPEATKAAPGRRPAQSNLAPRPGHAASHVREYREARLKRRNDPESFFWPATAKDAIPGLIEQVVTVEWPVSLQRVWRVVAGCWGKERLGGRIVAQMTAGTEAALARGRIALDDQFLSLTGKPLDQIPVRHGGPEGRMRSIDEISPDE